MSFIKLTEEMLNYAFTENGDKAYKTSGSWCLDYFSLVGGMRFNYNEALNNFIKAYCEDPILAIKIMFFARDIRSGLGERNIFRVAFNSLANVCPDVAYQLLKYIPEYGRYDDLLSAYDTPLRSDVIKMIKEQLDKDIEAKKNQKEISLLAKWLPSINTSSFETRELANKIAKDLGLKKEEYRKMLSFLRNGMIVENNLREKKYDFDYSNVPGKAMFKYQDAFLRNDKEKYLLYLDNVKEGKAKINSKTIYPYEIVRKFENEYGYFSLNNMTKSEIESLDTIWNSFDRNSIASKTIVVRDGSGSMYDSMPVNASSVATSLALLFSERLTGEFKNKFITFSSEPKLVEVKGNRIDEKLRNIFNYNDCSNTNISKVYQLIYSVYCSPKFTKEDALDRIVIISDMEFDCLGKKNTSTFEEFKDKFKELGYEMPELVFWNVRSRSTHLPVTKNEKNVKLISGSSSNVIDMVTTNSSKTPYEFMLECLEKYSCFDNIVI